MVVGKDVQEQFDRSCEKWRPITWSEGRKEHPTCSTTKVGKLDWLHLV